MKYWADTKILLFNYTETENGKKYSDRTNDTDYLSAVERGDTEAAQRMLNVFLNICFNNLRQYRTIHMCGIALSQIILLKNTFVI